MAYFKEWFLEINKHPDKLQFWKRLLGDGWNRLEYEDTQWIENILQKIHESFRTGVELNKDKTLVEVKKGTRL